MLFVAPVTGGIAPEECGWAIGVCTPGGGVLIGGLSLEEGGMTPGGGIDGYKQVVE